MSLGRIEPKGGSGLGRDSANLVANAEHGIEPRTSLFVQMIANIHRQVLWVVQCDRHAKLGIHVRNAICPCIRESAKPIRRPHSRVQVLRCGAE